MKIDEKIGHMEDNIGRIVKLLEIQEDKIPKEDEVGQGTHEEKRIKQIPVFRIWNGNSDTGKLQSFYKRRETIASLHRRLY